MGGNFSKNLDGRGLDFLESQGKCLLPCIRPKYDEKHGNFFQDDFKIYRYLLFEAVGLNSRGIYKKLLLDFYTSSNHVSLSTLQDIFGINSNKNPKKQQKSTQFLNICIKSGEFDRDKHRALFLIVYLKSNRSIKMFTKVMETQSLKVEWNESLSIPIHVKKDFKDEIIIEVGNFYDLTSNFCKNLENIQTMRKTVLEVSNSVTRHCTIKANGKISIDEEFLGDSHEFVVKLKKSGKKVFGQIHVQAEITELPSKESLVKEHEIVTKLGLMHDHEVTKGDFLTSTTEAIIEEHRKITHLTVLESIFVRWSTLAQLHEVFPFDFSVIDGCLMKIYQNLTNEIPIFFVQAFNRANKSILTQTLQRILDFSGDNHAFSVLNKIIGLKPSVRRNLHSPKRNILLENAVNDDLKKKIDETIFNGVNLWWNKCTNGVSFEVLEDVIKFLDDVEEFQEALLQAYSDIFKAIIDFNLHINLKNCIFRKILEVIVPIVEEIAQKLNIENDKIDKILSEFTQKESIKKYYEHLVQLMDTSAKEKGTFAFLVLKNLQKWYKHENLKRLSDIASPFWIHEATAKAMICIERAIDLDNLAYIDQNVRYSSSSVDFLCILKEFQTFWKDLQSLSCPEIPKIMFSVMKVTQLFIYLSIKKLDKLIDAKRDESESFLGLWITFLHNIYHIRQEIPSNLFPESLGKEEIFIEELQVEQEFAKRLILNIQHEMGIEKSVNDLSYADLKAKYETIFAILQQEFPNSSDLSPILNEIWTDSTTFFHEILDKAILAGAHIEFYCHLHEMIKSISHICTKISGKEFVLDKNLERKLFLNATESDDLIEQYYIERFATQNIGSTKSFGTLTVSVNRKTEVLDVTILNVKDLIPVDYKKNCDPYVKIRFVPLEHFKHKEKYHTKAKSKTNCAFFDETFHIPIVKINVHGSNFLHFMVVEKELMAKIHLGDAFLPLNEVLGGSFDGEQVHLKLTKANEDSEIIKCLENREHHDKIAKDFLKHLKTQLNHGHWATLQHHLYERQHSISDFIHSHTKNHHL